MTDQFKALTWNVQFFASKNYCFFFDMLDESGPHLRPARHHVEETLRGVARVLTEEAPDFMMLQEIDDGAARTYRADQRRELERLLPEPLKRHGAEAFYWRAFFVPHPKVWGSAGMKLVTLSPHPITFKRIHPLPQPPYPWWERPFRLKRCVLETRHRLPSGAEVTVFNTHLDAFAQGTDTMARQVGALKALIDDAEKEGRLWILGGDLNLIPDEAAYHRLQDHQKPHYRLPPGELSEIFGKYPSVPDAADLASGAPRWFTHHPNDPRVTAPDRTIDYLFYSPRMTRQAAVIRRESSVQLSDHLPLIARLGLG